MRRELRPINIGTFTVPAGTFRQRTDIPKTARDLLATLKIGVPPQDPRAHHARELIRAPRDEPSPPRGTAGGSPACHSPRSEPNTLL
jgi:hypothetical protein